jgi:GntR family transcriptional regulator of arabinose operon
MSSPSDSGSGVAPSAVSSEVLDRTSPIPLYHQLETALLKLIADRRLGPGALFPSEPRVAADFGVTRPTVRQALDRLVQVGVLRRERGRGTFVANPPETPRRELAGAIKVIMPSLSELIHLRVLAGIVDEAHAQQLQVVLTHSDNSYRVQERELASSASLTGVLLWPVSERGPNHALASLRAAQVPVVFVDRYLDAHSDRVVIDDQAGAHQATTHLLHLGHRRIAFVHGEAASLSSVQLRLRGYRRALREFGVEPDRRLVYGLGTTTVPPEADAVRRAVDRLLTLPQPPTAALGVNDVIAVALLGELERRKIRIPLDFSVVGFDALERPGDGRVLTSVHRATEELGHHATRLLAGLIRDEATADRPQAIILPTSLVLGDTTGPAGQARTSPKRPRGRTVRASSASQKDPAASASPPGF